MYRIKAVIFSIILGLFLPVTLAEPPRPQPPADDSTIALPVQELVQQARKSVVVIHGQGRDRNSMGIGSGFVVSDQGLVATNLHVIGQGRRITVELADGSEKPVRRIHAWDRGLDLAVLKIDSPGLTALPLGDSGNLTSGDPVVALGHPRGLRYSLRYSERARLSERPLRETIDKRQYALPGIGGRLGELVIFAIEEGVGGTVVDNDFVIVTGGFEHSPKRLDLIDRDSGVIATHQAQQRAGEFIDPFDERFQHGELG